MATISIDYNSENKEVYLCGDIEAIKRNRFAWRYVRDYFSPREEMGRIVIPVMDEEPFPILSSIRSMLSKYGFTEKKTESSEKILLDFYEEERKFDEFSQKALRIRNNECDKVEFEKFTNSIACHLPARSLYPLQLLSAYHMAFSQNACNFSVPGAGKTSIVYGAYAYLHSLPNDNAKHIDKLLVVGPLSSFGPWELEYEECFGHKPSVKRLISGISKTDKQDYLISSRTSELTLISYASLISLQKELGFFLRNNKVMVVLDEAHKAKNSSGEDNNQTNNYLIQSTVNFLFDADIFSINMFYYDSVQQQYRFKNESFPLKLSSVRNVLISQGFLCVDRGVTGSRFYVSPEYESLVASQCIRKRKAISLEQLKKRLKSDELAGEKAELFVVKYEKKRLGVEGENKVKRISEIDVTAGYDIVSANSPNSTVANRFIEVKAVSENGFYWSKNEYDIAKLLAADYYLYLVDLSKIDDDNYEPDIIHNPVQHIMENNLWLVEPQSYHIQKVKF